MFVIDCIKDRDTSQHGFCGRLVQFHDWRWPHLDQRVEQGKSWVLKTGSSHTLKHTQLYCIFFPRNGTFFHKMSIFLIISIRSEFILQPLKSPPSGHWKDCRHKGFTFQKLIHSFIQSIIWMSSQKDGRGWSIWGHCSLQTQQPTIASTANYPRCLQYCIKEVSLAWREPTQARSPDEVSDNTQQTALMFWSGVLSSILLLLPRPK